MLTGHSYTSNPGCGQVFPSLCEPTATLWTGDPPVTDTTTTGDRGAMKPNADSREPYVAERKKPPPF